MTETRFTPGPRLAECVGTKGFGPDSDDVYEITNNYRRIAEYVAPRDAHLIAAAPELYEALEAALESINDDAHHKAALAALAKARGEAQ